MSILSDKQIKALCLSPTAIVRHRNPRDTRRMMPEVETVLYSQPNTPAFDAELRRAVGDSTFEKGHVAWHDFMAGPGFKPMIEPFEPNQVRTRTVKEIIHELDDEIERTEKIVSYGLTSYGYDVRLAEDFRIFSNVNSAIVDPKRFDEKCLVEGKLQHGEGGDKYVIIPPNSYLLGHTIETFDIPRDVLVVAIGKSTYARAGAIVNVTPIEPGFKGTVVIEISNSTPSPLKIYANEGISQFVFYQGTQPCEVSYADRGGKYQNQSGIVLPKT